MSTYRQVSLRHIYQDEAERAAKQAEKEALDKQYETEVQKLSQLYYNQKRTIGVTAKETAKYQADKLYLWNLYQVAAIEKGLWQEVTPEMELQEAEDVAAMSLERLKEVRRQQQLPEKTLAEVNILEK